MNEVPCVLQDFVSFGAAAQKEEEDKTRTEEKRADMLRRVSALVSYKKKYMIQTVQFQDLY